MSRNPAQTLPLDDLEATDRLPVLDPSAFAEDDAAATTGEWPAPDAAAAGHASSDDTLAQLLGERDGAIADLTSSLRDKSLAVSRLERELELAQGELARQREDLAQRLRAAEIRMLELDEARLALATQLDARRASLASLEMRAVEAERRATELAAEIAALTARLSAAERAAAQSQDEQSAALLRSRDEAEQRCTRLESALASATAELEQAHEALSQRERALSHALEARQSDEARRRYISDFRHATPLRRLQRELATANESIATLSASLAAMETAQAESRAASEAGLRELWQKLRSAEQAREDAEQRARDLAVRARDAEATLAVIEAGEDYVAGADEPTIAQEDRDALARKIEELSGEVARRDDRIITLEAELRAQAEALDNIRRSVGALGAGRSRGHDSDSAPDATLSRRYLVALDDGPGGTVVLDRQRITVGRTPENGLPIREPYISRLHAVLRLGPEVAVVEDAASTNGVFVNDHRVQRHLLHDGDIVAFGKARFRFQLQPPAAAG